MPLLIDSSRLVTIWQQQAIPVAWTSGEKATHFWPNSHIVDNKVWLGSMGRNRPHWNAEQRYWEIPKSWFNTLVDRSIERFGKIYVVQPYLDQEKCAPACMNAAGHECQCSCKGANHGGATTVVGLKYPIPSQQDGVQRNWHVD